MKQESPRFARAMLLFTAAACMTTPVLAQDQQVPLVTPPPPSATPTPAPAPTPQVSAPAAPAGNIDAQAAPQTSDVPGADKNSTTPVDPGAAQGAREEAEAARETRRAPPRRAAPSRTERTTQTTRTTTATPSAASAPTAQPTPAASPSATTPPAAATSGTSDAIGNTGAADGNAVAPVTDGTIGNEAAVTTDESAVTNTTATTTSTGGFPWLWVILGVIVLAGVAFFFVRRRAAEPEYQPVYGDAAIAEPVAAAPVARSAAEPAPLAPAASPPVTAPTSTATAPAGTIVADASDVAPVAAEDATLAEPEAADVAALTAAAPTGDRAWLELALRPLRAGTNVDEALVEVELTVANAGSVTADDVRIATYLLPAGDAAEVARVLDTPPSDAAVEPRSIAPGEGAAVNATLALPRASLTEAGANAFQPVVVADVRYRLNDGTEGRTSAAFEVGGVDESGGFSALDLERPLMREDVEARLYGQATRI